MRGASPAWPGGLATTRGVRPDMRGTSLAAIPSRPPHQRRGESAAPSLGSGSVVPPLQAVLCAAPTACPAPDDFGASLIRPGWGPCPHRPGSPVVPTPAARVPGSPHMPSLLPRRVPVGRGSCGGPPGTGLPPTSTGSAPPRLSRGYTWVRCTLRPVRLRASLGDTLVRELSASGYPGHPRRGSPPSSHLGGLPSPRAGLPPASPTVSTAYGRCTVITVVWWDADRKGRRPRPGEARRRGMAGKGDGPGRSGATTRAPRRRAETAKFVRRQGSLSRIARVACCTMAGTLARPSIITSACSGTLCCWISSASRTTAR